MKIPISPGDLTSEWLTQALREGGAVNQATVTSVAAHAMGDEEGLTGSGQVARLRVTYDRAEADAPQTLIAKLSSPDPIFRALLHSLEFYGREVRFYQELANQVALRTPHCYYSALDSETGLCVLLLEDLAPIRSGGKNYAFCSLEEAELAIAEIARFHATWWESPRLAKLTWLRREAQFYQGLHEAYRQRWTSFTATVGHTLPEAVLAIGERFGRNPGDYWHVMLEPPQTIIHWDFNLGSLLFLGTSGDRLSLAVIDWQTVSIGRSLFDVAQFLGRHLSPENRRAKETALLKMYHSILAENGVQGYSFDQCWHDYRLFMLTDLWKAVFFIGGERTPKAQVDAFSNVVLPGCCTALLDLNVGELLPK